jgi:hypothetical protein
MILNEARNSYPYLIGLDSLRHFLSKLAGEFFMPGFPPSRSRLQFEKSALILDRRLQHMAETHDVIMSLYIDQIFKKSFLHLQTRHLESISSGIGTLFEYIRNSGPDFNECDADDLREAEVTVHDILRDTIDKVQAQAGDVVLAMPLTNMQVSICMNIYKYPDELTTLRLFMTQNFPIIKGYNGSGGNGNFSGELKDF